MSKATRKAFGEALRDLGEKYQDVVCYDADLSKSTMSCLFAEKFPHRFFEMGIQEANMVGCAAGAANVGKIPFICSFACFLTGRYDQIRMSIGYGKANVKLVGTHAGVGIGEDGHSQMGLEDLALMRAIPGMTVLQPATEGETRDMVEWAIKHQGPVYLRLTRQALNSHPGLEHWSPESFSKVEDSSAAVSELEGKKGHAFLASGGLLDPALEASELLKSRGVMAPDVYSASIIKPLPHDFMEKLVARYHSLTVLEDHTVMGGVGSAIVEWVTDHVVNKGLKAAPLKVYRYGVQDVFGESGSPADMYELHGFTAEKICKFHQNLSLNS